MSVGLGIFLGSVVIGSVLLYLNTRDTWNWRRIRARFLITIGILVGVVTLLSVGFFTYEKWDQRLKLVTRLEGISVGEKLSDVVFRLGTFVRLQPDKDVVQRNKDDQVYEQKEKRVHVWV